MSNKEVGIYLMNKEMFEEKTVEKIVDRLEGILKIKGYHNCRLEKENIRGYRIKLYNKISSHVDTWSEFWGCKKENENIVEGSETNNYIALIYSNNNIFAVATNRAYNDINDYIVHFYGVCVMSHFIKDDDKIRSATYTNIMSDFLGRSEYLGQGYQATIDKYWDRINTNLMGELDKERLYKELGLQNKRKITKVRCDAKDNFTICSKINIKQLVQIIKQLDKISTNDLIDKFNTIERIKDDYKIKELEKEMKNKIFQDYKQNKLDLCIVHKNIEKFFSSMEYIFLNEGINLLSVNTIPNIQDLKRVFDGMNIKSIQDMSKIDNIQLICKDSNEKIQLSDKLLSYLNITLEINRENYVMQNNVWYRLRDSYISNLEEIFKIIKNNFEEKDIKFKKWDNKTESEYINLYDGKQNFYKIHPKLEDEIEICDLMYIDRNKRIIKMIYIKNGFGANTRDLAIQTVMGMKRFLSIINDSKKLKNFYDKYIKCNTYAYDDFRKDVKSFCKNAVIVYKLPDKNQEKSNIGKQSIVYAKNAIEQMGKCKFTMKQL